jgi:hypothetical protein
MMFDLVQKFFEGIMSNNIYDFVELENINSITQYGVIAILTLQIPLIIEVFSTFNHKATTLIEKDIIQKTIRLKLLGGLVASSVVVQFTHPIFNLIISTIVIILLARQVFEVINYILDKNKYEKEYFRNLVDITNGKTTNEIDFMAEKVDEYLKNKKVQPNSDISNYVIKFLKSNYESKSEKLADFIVESYRYFQENQSSYELYSDVIDHYVSNNPKHALRLIKGIVGGDEAEPENINNLLFPKTGKDFGLESIFHWHYQAWDTAYGKLYKDKSDWFDYDQLYRYLDEIVKKLLVNSLLTKQNGIEWYVFLKELKKHLYENRNKKIVIQSSEIEPKPSIYYLGYINIYQPFLENVSNSPYSWELEKRDDMFPGEWRTSTTSESNLISRYWWNNLYDYISRNYLNKFKDNELEISNLIKVFFKDSYQEYVAIVLFYMFNCYYQQKGRIKHLIDSNFTGFLLDTALMSGSYKIGEEESYKQMKADEMNKAKENAIGILYSLFKKTIDKNIAADMEEVEKLKNDDTLTDSQKSYLQTVEEIWKRLLELSQSQITSDKPDKNQ